jgi:hypothetical protein
MKRKTKFMFRKKHVISIHNIGSKDNEDGEVTPTIFVDEKWATEYCDTFLYNLKVDRFNKTS